MLGIRPLAVVIQLMRNSLLEVFNQDYIRTARAKGLSEFQIIKNHAVLLVASSQGARAAPCQPEPRGIRPDSERNIIRRRYEPGHDLLFPGFFEIHRQLVALDPQDRAIAEFLVKHPVANRET